MRLLDFSPVVPSLTPLLSRLSWRTWALGPHGAPPPLVAMLELWVRVLCCRSCGSWLVFVSLLSWRGWCSGSAWCPPPLLAKLELWVRVGPSASLGVVGASRVFAHLFPLFLFPRFAWWGFCLFWWGFHETLVIILECQSCEISQMDAQDLQLLTLHGKVRFMEPKNQKAC